MIDLAKETTILNKIIALSDLKWGQKAIIIAYIEKPNAHRRRLLDMGMTIGTFLFIKKISPFKDPIGVQLRGYELCVRKEELKNILVQVMPS